MLKARFIRQTVSGLVTLMLGAAPADAQDNPYQKPVDPASQDNPYQKPVDPASLKRIQKASDPEAVLNAALNEVRSLQARGVAVTDVPLDSKLLSRLNVWRGEKSAESGFLRLGGEFPWPTSLRDYTSTKARDEFWTKFRQAVKEGKPNVRPEVTSELRQALERVVEELRQKINDIPTSQYLESKRLLNRIETTVKALDDPAWQADLAAAKAIPIHGKTVAALVRYLGEKGLQIAPALPGDEDANRELGRAVTVFLENARPRKR